MKSVIKDEGRSGGGGCEAEGGLNHSWAQGQSHHVFSKTQKQPQCNCQAKTVAGSSLTPHAALLVHPINCHEFTGLEKYFVKANLAISLALSLVCLDSATVWLS